ncbi:hypothetical protein NEOC95_001390 [Neochlamydia sp. AcF95]|nr:hypothetical protein [Neochlamydia sp. AcF95]
MSTIACSIYNMVSLAMQLKVVCNRCLSHRLLGTLPKLLCSIFGPPLACQSP